MPHTNHMPVPFLPTNIAAISIAIVTRRLDAFQLFGHSVSIGWSFGQVSWSIALQTRGGCQGGCCWHWYFEQQQQGWGVVDENNCDMSLVRLDVWSLDWLIC